MKKPMKVSFYALGLGLVLLAQGCVQDAETAFWWLPAPWMPVQFSAPVDATQSGGGSSGGSSSAGIGGN